MPGLNAALLGLYFFTMRICTSAKTVQQQIRIWRIVLQQSICVRYAKRSQGTSVGLCCRCGSHWLMKSGRNWFKSKHILLLSTWQNNFNDIFLIKFSGKCSGLRTKITKQNFTPVRIKNNERNFSAKITNELFHWIFHCKKSESFYWNLQSVKNG
jgi:hypothetical protein